MYLMKKILLIICFAGIVFSSCTTLLPVSFDRLQAADVNFPEQIRRVGVINCMSSVSQSDNDTALKGDGKIMAEVLAQEIAETRYFDQVMVADSAFLAEDAVLSAGQVDSLMHDWGVDALLTVEQIGIELWQSELFVSELMAVVHGVVTPVVKVYVPVRTAPLFVVSKSDTIVWQVNNSSFSLEQVVKDASEYAALIPMKHLLPYWQEMERYYFDGGEADMRDAGVCVREQDWEGAAALWQNVYDKKSGKKKMRAAYNLALYHEMRDDFVRAKEYLDVALSLTGEDSWERQLVQSYRLQLDKQAADFQMLKIQMKRFE